MSVLCVVQATVLEEMPPFPERESSILAKLKKKKGPGTVSVTDLEDSKREGGELNGGGERGPDTAAMASSNAVSRLCGASINSISWLLLASFHVYQQLQHKYYIASFLCFTVHPVTVSRPPWDSFGCPSWCSSQCWQPIGGCVL